MSSFKKTIIEVGSVPNEQRKKFWLDKLKLPDIELTYRKTDEKINYNIENQVVIFEQWPKSSELKQFYGVPAEILDVGSFECVFRENGQSVVRILITEAMRRLITEKAPNLSNLNIAYVTGEKFDSAAAVILLIKMGFRKIYWVVPDPEMIKKEVVELRKKYFDVLIEPLLDSDLTLRGNDGSIFVNFYTEANNERTEALSDFAYLNFLKYEGLVLDVPFSVWSNDILQEAKNSNVKFVDSIEIHGFRDFLFLQNLHIKLPSVEEYLKMWRELCQDSG